MPVTSGKKQRAFFKLILLLPIVWFCVIVFLIVTNAGDFDLHSHDHSGLFMMKRNPGSFQKDVTVKQVSNAINKPAPPDNIRLVIAEPRDREGGPNEIVPNKEELADSRKNNNQTKRQNYIRSQNPGGPGKFFNIPNKRSRLLSPSCWYLPSCTHWFLVLSENKGEFLCYVDSNTWLLKTLGNSPRTL